MSKELTLEDLYQELLRLRTVYGHLDKARLRVRDGDECVCDVITCFTHTLDEGSDQADGLDIVNHFEIYIDTEAEDLKLKKDEKDEIIKKLRQRINWHNYFADAIQNADYRLYNEACEYADSPYEDECEEDEEDEDEEEE